MGKGRWTLLFLLLQEMLMQRIVSAAPKESSLEMSSVREERLLTLTFELMVHSLVRATCIPRQINKYCGV